MLLAGTAAFGQPLEWSRFQDPKEPLLLTEPFARQIAGLPPEQKARAILQLKAALRSPHLEVRRRAALTLGALGDRSGVPTMIQDMATPDANDRGNIAVALLTLNDRRAIPTLRQALKDRLPYVRGRALAALGRVKAREAFADIVSHLQDKEEEGGCISSAPARSACSALGELGDKRAIPFLVRALDDRYLTGPAVQALGELTKQPFGYDTAKWKQWWQEQKRKR